MNKTDRKIIAAALLLLLCMLYLLYNDDLLLRQQDLSHLKTIGKISEVNHDVRQKINRQFSWKSLRGPKELHLGDSLFTGKNSQVRVSLDDGRALTLQENSLVVFNMTGDQLNLDLRSGKVSGTLDGCLKVTSAGGTEDLCGKNAQIEIKKDGTLEVTSPQQPAVVEEKIGKIEWTVEPEKIFYHFKNSTVMKISWKAPAGKAEDLAKFKLQISRRSDFKKVSFEVSSRETAAQTRGYPTKGVYFIRVVAENWKAKPIAISDAIKTEFREISPPTLTAPKADQRFIFPVDSDGDLPEKNVIQIRWDYSMKTSKFEYSIASNSDFSNPVRKEMISGSISDYEIRDLANGEYYLRIRDAALPVENSEIWSAPISFRVEIPKPSAVPPPLLITRKIQHIAPSEQSPQIRWSKVGQAEHYSIETSSSESFSKAVSFESKTTDFAWPETKQGQTYFRVRTVTAKGKTSEPSEVGVLSYRYRQPDINPVPPKLLLGKSPEDPGEPTDFQVSWTDMKVESYQVQVSDEPEFKEPWLFDSKTPTAAVKVPKPGEFLFRVRGMQNGAPVTKFSKTGKLSYELQVPLSTPNLTEPSDQMTLFFQQSSLPFIWLEWTPVRQAAVYQVELAYDSKFEKKVFAIETKDRRFLIRQQLPESVLYWRVRATGDGQRISNWSPIRSMSILAGRAPANSRPSKQRNK